MITYGNRLIKFFMLFILFFTLSIFFQPAYSQIETKPIPGISYLGIQLGMTRDQIIENGNFTSEAAKQLEIDELSSLEGVDDYLIEAKAIPFIKKLYLQFVKDPTDSDNLKLYTILIHFNEEYIGYYELLDLLSKGLEIENPEFDSSSSSGDSNKRMIKFLAYGTPTIVESERAIWDSDSEENKVKIILSRSNEINRFGNVVRFIHKDGMKLVLALNNPESNLDIDSIDFSELTPATNTEPLFSPADIGRRLYFISNLLPQELREEE